MQSGEQCVPEILVDPCVEYSTAVQLTCPENNVNLWYLPEASDALPLTKCRVCGFGQVGQDQDHRKGYYESDIFFGQNSIESMITEDPIVEYRVYLVDAMNRRLTRVLAVVPKGPEEETTCCRADSYRAHIFTVLPPGYKRFMVVPVSNLGKEMPAGTVSDDVVDRERGAIYNLGTFPRSNFSFLVNVVNDMKVGNGSLMLQSPGHEVNIPCTRLRLLKRAAVVPVLVQLLPDELYQVLLDRDCLIVPSTNESVDLVSPAHGLHFQTEHENATENDIHGPRLLDAYATFPQNGALQSAREFHFFFNEVALRGPGALAVVRHSPTAVTVVDHAPTFRSVLGVPGMVVVRPRQLLEPGRHEVVFGPGAIQDALGNMAHSSKEFEERGEWEHRVACFFGDCGETPAFGLDDYVIQVPVEGAQAAQYPEAPWTSFPQPGELMFKHENVVFDFTGQVSPGDLENVIEFCSNWTTTDVCLMKRTIQLKDMLFVGSKVIINPPQDLDPGFSYNVSIQSGVVASFASVYADGSGRFAYNIQVRAEAPDRSAPVLVAVEVVCQSDDVNSSTIWNETDGFGCGAWLPAERINGEPPLWGFKGLVSPVALPAADRGSVHIRFVFREPVLLELGAAAAPAVFLYTSETGSIRQEVPAFVGTEVEDSVVTAVPNLLPGHLYTLELGKGVIDTATWPEPNRFEEGVALTFFTYLTTPNISLASNDGLQEADPSSVIKLSFEGPAKLADPFSDLQAEIVQVNPMVDSPDRQQMLVSDPGSVVFFGHEVLFLPRRLLAGTSYRFTLPAGSVLHFDEPLSFLFTTRSQDLVAPSIVWTWPTQTLSKLQIDRMLVQIYFSEAVEATPGKFIILRDDRGMRHPLPVDRPCRAGLVQGCIQMDMEGRRLSLLPMGQSMTGEMIPWAGPGRTYMVDIEEDAFSDAGTVGELRKNLLKASSFSFSVYPDTDGPVLATSMPSNNSGDVEPVRDSILLVFDEVVQAVQSDFSVMSTSLVRPMEAPQLDMPPGEIAVNPGVGVITLAFNVDVEAGSGFFHIMVLSDTPTVRGNITEFDAELIKEVPVEEAFFVKNLVMLSPFPLSLDMNALFFVGANETAVVATNGVNLAMELSTWQEAQVQFRITPTLLGVVYSSWRDWRCFTKLTDVELYMNEHIIGLNTSDRAITLRDATGQMVWRLWADEMQTDANHLQVSLDPLVPFKATIHAGELPPNLPGGNSKPLPETGGVYMLEVDAGLFIDRPEEIQENVTVVVPVGATCGDFNFSCGPGRRHIDNATLVRCASRDACTELDDNLTCCEDVIVDMLNVTACINGSNCSNDTEELELTARRLMGLEPTLEIQTVTYLEVAGSPMLSVDFRVCETRYQDLAGRSARIYVPLEVKRSVITGRLRPQLFEAYIPTTAVQDVLGNVPQESAMISFAHDLQMPELDPFRCHPLNSRNATEQESIQLSFSEPVKAGSGFFELWDINDVTGPKIRIDVEMLAQPNRDFLGRKLIDGNVVSLFPDLLCVGGCLELGNDVTYFLVTRTPGVLYDMMDNPLPMLNTSNSWRFYVSENVTRAPEVLRVSYAFNITNYTVSGIPELQEVYGYVYFTQRIYLNNSFPGMTRMFSEIQIRDCGSNFDCSTFQAVEPMIFVEPWGSSQLGLEPGLAQFRFEAPMEARRFQVTVLSRSFMGADTSKGSMAGPLEPYTFLVDTGPDPRIQPDRPFILPGGVEPAGNKVPSKTNVTMVFSEEVLPGSGNISFCTQLMQECTVGLLADGSYATLDVSEALVERRQVTWITEEFAFGQTLHILIPEGLFISADARAMPMGRSSGEYSFTIREGDVVPPRVIAIEATERRNGMVQMIFSESVIFEGDHGRRGVLVLETEGRPVRFNATAHGAVVTVYGPFRTGESYQLRHSVSPLMDIMRNYAIIVPLDAENFTISDDMKGPTVHLPNQQRVSVHDVFYIMFDEGVLPGQRYCQLHSLPPVSCGITCGRSNPLLINVSADVHHFEQGGRLRSLVQVDPGKDLLPGFGYHLQIDTGFVEDSVGNPCESVQQTYQVDLQRDLIPPQLLLATINGHGGPVPSFDQDVHGKGIELYFSEVLQTLPMDADETVVLHLLPSNGGDRCGEFDNACAIGQNCSFPCDYLPAQQGLSIAADALELRGAIVSIPSSRMPLLEYGRGYRLVVHLDLFTDLAGNMASAGQSHGLQEELVFRVAPAEAQSMKELMLVQSLPMDGQTMVPETTSLQLVFNMEVKAGSGDFVLLPVVQDQMDKSLVGTLECEDCNESNDTEMNGTNQSELDEVWHLRQDHSLNLSNGTVMPGTIYGFACKIRIPMVPPTGSANQFTIEFGYNQDNEINRLEAGTAAAPTVQRLINGAITYTTSIIALAVDITFSVRTITNIPEGGGLVIIGPPNFLFSTFCQPKPATNYPELPYDSTCLYAPIGATGEPKIEVIAGPTGVPAKYYQFSLAAVNPPQAVPLSEAGQWTFLSYSLISENIILDQNTTVPGYAVARPMVSADLVMWSKVDCTFITLEERAIDATLPETFCDFEHWQFYPPRGYRDDRPNRPTQLIFKMQLNANVEATSTLTVRAPVGYVFDAECRVVTTPSSRIFNDSAVTGDLPRVPENVPLDPALTHTIGPPEKRTYAQRYDPWPTGVGTDSCLGRDNEARITFEAGLELFKTYLFRLAVLRNPPVTPEYNYFLLEYNGEASLPFLGVNIWAFMNTSILPTTTAASRADYLTNNEVTIQLRPVNVVPFGGHVRVTAPSGFTVPTDCVMSLSVHESEMPNISSYPAGTARAQVLQWAEFLPSDLVCQGDQTPSSRGRLLLIQNNKYMRAQTLYVLTLKVVNPQTTSAVPEDWHVQSYQDLTVNQIIDESYIPGFVVNTAVQSFAYLKPESTNALVKQRLDFNMSFPETVAIGDQLQIVAPVSYLFSEPGDRRCPQYVFLDGAMTKTVPTCSANIISWVLMDESIPALSPVRFMVQVQNPPRTPTINLFQVRQLDANGTRKSSRMLEGYEIVPELVMPKISQAPSILPCRIDVNLVTGLACEGTGSFSTAVITFTATRSAELVSIQAKVDLESFDFTNARFGDGVDGPMTVYGRSMTMVVVEMMVHNGVGSEITIHNIKNPMTPGMSTWAVTTYTKGAVAGAPVTTTLMPLVTCTSIGGACGTFPPAEARRDEGLDLPGPAVLGYIRVDQNSFINPIYYGVPNALVTFELRGETSAEVNDVLVVRRPPGYSLTEGTLRALRSVSFGENGLDFMRKWSTDFANPEDFYAVLTQPVPASTTIRFQLGVASPALAEKVMNWYFKTWRVLPLVDEDGVVVDASMPAYPWLGRNITATGTSDGAFAGFLLVGQVPFSVVPSLQTPGAEIKLTINLGVADGVEAQESVRMEVLAPAGFVFADSCRYGGSPIFSKCTGFQNQVAWL